MPCRSFAPSMIANTSHSFGSRSSCVACNSFTAARIGITPRCGTLSAIRLHSSMRRAPSMRSDSVDTWTAASSCAWPTSRSSNEKNPSRHDMSSNTTVSICKRTWRSSSRAEIAPIWSRISPNRFVAPFSCCTFRARSRSRSVMRPARTRTAPSGFGLDRMLAEMTRPRSNSTVPSLSRSTDVTRNAPVFRLRSSSWKTSCMLSSRSGPSIAMA